MDNINVMNLEPKDTPGLTGVLLFLDDNGNPIEGPVVLQIGNQAFVIQTDVNGIGNVNIDFHVPDRFFNDDLDFPDVDPDFMIMHFMYLVNNTARQMDYTPNIDIDHGPFVASPSFTRVSFIPFKWVTNIEISVVLRNNNVNNRFGTKIKIKDHQQGWPPLFIPPFTAVATLDIPVINGDAQPVHYTSLPYIERLGPFILILWLQNNWGLNSIITVADARFEFREQLAIINQIELNQLLLDLNSPFPL